jgi:phospholipase C
VPPPAVTPPLPGAGPGQFGFGFDRSGVRVPAIAVSAWIPERTVVTPEYRHTSMIRTLRGRWPIGGPLTARDEAARDIAPVLSLQAPRPPQSWPEVVARPVPPYTAPVLPPDADLRALSKAALLCLVELGKGLGMPTREFEHSVASGDVYALAMINDVFGRLFPHLSHASGSA